MKRSARFSDHTAEFVRGKRPKVYNLDLIHLIFELPYCRIQKVVEAKIAERQAASRHLKQLAEIGVLEEKPVGREKFSSTRSCCDC